MKILSMTKTLVFVFIVCTRYNEAIVKKYFQPVWLAGAFLIIGILILFGFYTFFGKPGIFVNTNSANVIKELKELNRLETASFTIEKIIEAGTEPGNVFQNLLYGDRILLIANGEIIAGFDLSQMSENDIDITGKTLTLTLPAPTIFIATLNNEKTRVYDRRQGLLSSGNKDLESQARLAAEESIREAACEGNILDEAAENARKQLTALFKTLGFTTVIIEIPQGSC